MAVFKVSFSLSISVANIFTSVAATIKMYVYPTIHHIQSVQFNIDMIECTPVHMHTIEHTSGCCMTDVERHFIIFKVSR